MLARLADLEVDRCARLARERLDEVRPQLEPDVAAGQRIGPRLDVADRAPAEVDRAERQGLVHRQADVAVAPDAGTLAERLVDRPAQHERRVLDRVVLVDVHVAAGAHLEVDERVAREQGQQVVEEADRRLDRHPPGSVEVDPDANLGLCRRSLRGARSAHDMTSFSASSSRPSSGSSRAVARSQPAIGPVS